MATDLKYLIIFDYDGVIADSLMIGDAVSDIREAHKAGVNSIAVNWGYHPGEKLLQASPGYMVNAPEDIVAIVR